MGPFTTAQADNRKCFTPYHQKLQRTYLYWMPQCTDRMHRHCRKIKVDAMHKKVPTRRKKKPDSLQISILLELVFSVTETTREREGQKKKKSSVTWRFCKLKRLFPHKSYLQKTIWNSKEILPMGQCTFIKNQNKRTLDHISPPISVGHLRFIQLYVLVQWLLFV